MTSDLLWGQIGGGRVVYLSPHSDDAAFSSAGVLHACGRRGISVQIVTCFSRSANSRTAPGSDVERNSEVRKEEDRRFAATLPGAVRLRWLELDDAPLRPAHAGKHPCKETTKTADDDAIAAHIAAEAMAEVAEGVTAGADNLPATWIFAPLGLGRHIDHLVVRDAGAALARNGRARVAFWEDLPYAGRVGPEALQREIEVAIEAIGVRLEPSLVPVPELDLEALKNEALGCYPSQVIEVHRQGVLTHLRRVSGTGVLAERLWLPPARHGHFPS